MDIENLPENYIVAEGPSGLAALLDEFLVKAKQDAAFAAETHYILYQLGNQKSLITVDTSRIPFHFTYEDFLGRPATMTVKETIGWFLWEKCGEKERIESEQPGRGE